VWEGEEVKRSRGPKRTRPLGRRKKLHAKKFLERKHAIDRASRKALKRKEDQLAFRAIVLEAAGYQCERCGFAPRDSGMLEAHHRLPKSRGGTNVLANGACLCRACHRGAHDHTIDDWRDWIVRR
jgi:predicted restriction endonuclease